MNPAESVAEVYDDFARTYERSRGQFDISEVLEDFTANLPQRGSLLDLGCGAGEPVASTFVSRGWHVTGVDVSGSMLALAETHVLAMTRIRADMATVELPSDVFDAVTAVYSLFHVPSQQHPTVFASVHRWLKPGGQFLFTYATQKYTGCKRFDGTKDFLGQELFYSHTTPAEMFGQLADAQLHVISAIDRTIGGETFLWVTTQKVG